MNSGNDLFWSGAVLAAVVVCMAWIAGINIMENHCEQKHNIYDCEMVFQPVTETSR